MTLHALSAQRVQELYRSYRQRDIHREWRQRYRDAVTKFARANTAAFHIPAMQAELWSLRAVSSAGPGDSLDVQGAFTDPAIVHAIIELRERTWPVGAQARAAELEAAYGRILALVSPKHSKRRPWAKLARVFAALLPRDTHCGLNGASRGVISGLLCGTADESALHSSVLARARLREILGQEADLDDDVARSTFCWWLYENVETLSRGSDPELAAPPPASEPQPQLPTPVAILPGPRLRRGFPSFQGYAVTVRLIVEAAQGGASPDDIVEALRSVPGYETTAPKHARRMFNNVRYLHMLRPQDGLWYPSADGERLLNDARYDALVERMLCETFGLAHYLHLLAENGPMTRLDTSTRLRALYPAWKTDYAPRAVADWARSLGLITLGDDGRADLTEYGDEWVGRLPAELPVPPVLTEIDDGGDGTSEVNEADAAVGVPRSTGLRSVPLATISEIIRAAAPDMVLEDDILCALHLAWHSSPTKRFVIFSGLSGTGKTALLKLYAEAYCSHLALDAARHLTIATVSPDWRDPSGLIGYFNALHADPTYRAEPALRLILDAHRHPDLPYFLLLDEMNLARVEHYFAPFLSAMETGDVITLHAHDESINHVPPSIPWPRNLFIGGTVNMDETTFSISDKVLDRAFTIEFWDVDLKLYFERRASLPDIVRHPDAEALLLGLHEILKAVRRHFGYRTAREILALLDAAVREGMAGDALIRSLDQAVFSKVLPRIRGEESGALRSALDAAVVLCTAAGLRRSALKLGAMKSTLVSTGLTKFWA